MTCEHDFDIEDDGAKDWMLAILKEVCEDCKGTGQVCVGRSGDEWDGNAPVMERCPSCGY